MAASVTRRVSWQHSRAWWWCTGALLALAGGPASAITGPCHPNLVISQIYGGGGNAGATYTNDFVELHNPGAKSVSLSGFAVQYAAATGQTWFTFALPNTAIAPGGYFLVQYGSTSQTGAPLPPPDASTTTNMSGTGGKVVLTSSTTTLTGPCPSSGNIVDKVGYGALTDCFEGSAPAPGPSDATQSVKRNEPCGDTDANSTDFTVGPVLPRNSSTPALFCACTVNETDLAMEADFCNLQFPSTINVASGATTPSIYAQIYEAGVTEPAGADPSIVAQIGYGPNNVDPSTQAGFTWFSAPYNVQFNNNDEYQASFTAPSPGTYRYGSRFTFDGVNWTYCDLDGAGSNVGLTFSAAQLGMMTVSSVFTDDPIAAGITIVKAVHVTELRTHIDAQRVRFGLSVFAWTDPSLAAGAVVSAVHILELRTALQDAYTAATITPPTFSDPGLVTGATPVKAVHVQEIRTAVVTLEGS